MKAEPGRWQLDVRPVPRLIHQPEEAEAAGLRQHEPAKARPLTSPCRAAAVVAEIDVHSPPVRVHRRRRVGATVPSAEQQRLTLRSSVRLSDTNVIAGAFCCSEQ